jgi:cytochrome P450
MTAMSLPSVALRQKPEPVRTAFRDVGSLELKAVPGRRGLPFLGILPQAVRDPLRFTRKMYEAYGPVHRFRACGSWNVQLVGPEANEFVLADRDKLFSSEGGWRPVFGRHFGGGLLLRDGDDHGWHRKLVATAFKQEQLQNYLDVFCRNIANILGPSPSGAHDLYELSQSLTFANGFEAFLGRDAARSTRQDLLAFRYLMRSAVAVVPFALPGTAERRARWAKRHIVGLITPLLGEPIEPGRTDLLAMLQRMRGEALLDDREILSHLTFVIAASFDALSSATTSTLYYLAANPEWQARVRDELCSTIARSDRMALADVQQCELAEWSIKESLRLNAAAPVLWRRATRKFSFGGYDFPDGTIAGVNPMLTHLLPSIWDRPGEYDPFRFRPEEVRARHRYAFVPFGAGAHACLGANFAYLQLRALLRILLEGHEVRATGAPSWYHWPNCRPRSRLTIELVPLRRSRCSIQPQAGAQLRTSE